MTVVRRLPLVPLFVVAFLFLINSNVVVDTRDRLPSKYDQNYRSGEVDDTAVAPKSPRVLQLVSPRRTSLEDRFRVALKDASADCNRLTEGKVGFDCQLHVEQQLGPIDFVADAYIKIEVNNDEQTYNLDGWIDISPAIGRHPFELDEIKIKDPQPFCYVSGVKGCIGVRNVKIDTEKRIFEGIIYLKPCWVQLVELCLTFDVYLWKITWEADAVSGEVGSPLGRCNCEADLCTCKATYKGIKYKTDLLHHTNKRHEDSMMMPITADERLLLLQDKQEFRYSKMKPQCEEHGRGETFRCFVIRKWTKHPKKGTSGKVVVQFYDGRKKSATSEEVLFAFTMDVTPRAEFDQFEVERREIKNEEGRQKGDRSSRGNEKPKNYEGKEVSESKEEENNLLDQQTIRNDRQIETNDLDEQKGDQKTQQREREGRSSRKNNKTRGYEDRIVHETEDEKDLPDQQKTEDQYDDKKRVTEDIRGGKGRDDDRSSRRNDDNTKLRKARSIHETEPKEGFLDQPKIKGQTFEDNVLADTKGSLKDEEGGGGDRSIRDKIKQERQEDHLVREKQEEEHVPSEETTKSRQKSSDDREQKRNWTN